MKGSLLVDVEAVPDSLQLMNLAPGEAGVVNVSVQRVQDSTATVKSVRIEDTEKFSIREIETQPGALVTYEVRFAGGKVGTHSTKVVVETTGKHTPKLSIPVRANAATNLTYPKRVNLTRRGDGTVDQNLRISTRRGDPPKIGKVEDPDGLLDIEVLAPQGPSVNIRLRLRDGAKIDEKKTHELVVHTNDPDEPKVEIEYVLKSAPAARPVKAQ